MADKIEKKGVVKSMVVPYSDPLEKEILSIIMQESDSFILNEIFTQLSKKYFYIARNQILFQALFDRFNQGLPCDLISISMAMPNDEKEKIGGLQFLSDIQRTSISSVLFQEHIDNLKELYRNRLLIRLANRVSDRAYNNEESQDIITELERLVQEVNDDIAVKGFAKLGDVYQSVMDDIIEQYRNPKKENSLKTGFPMLDEYLNGGFKPGQMVVLAARPGRGKTTFAMQIVANIAKADPSKVVAVFNLEMAKEEITKRLLSTYSLVNAGNVSTVSLSSEDLEELLKTKEIFAKSHVFIEDTAMIAVSQIFSKVKKLKYENDGKLDLVVVDHMQLISQEKDQKRALSRYELTTEVSRMMKIMAKELKVPVLVLSQMSRNQEQESSDGKKGRKPILADLRESGAIEQDADIVLFLAAADFIVPNAEELGSNVHATDIMIAKNRSGRNDIDVHTLWYKDKMFFEEIRNVSYPKEGEQKEKKETKEETEEQNEVYSDDPGFPPDDNDPGDIMPIIDE